MLQCYNCCQFCNACMSRQKCGLAGVTWHHHVPADMATSELHTLVVSIFSKHSVLRESWISKPQVTCHIKPTLTDHNCTAVSSVSNESGFDYIYIVSLFCSILFYKLITHPEIVLTI